MKPVLVLVAMIAFAACSGDDDSSGEPPSTTSASQQTTTTTSAATDDIGEEAAIEIATEAYSTEDPAFDFDATNVHVERVEATYDVSWVPREITGAGGEPHVVVDAESGAVIEIYQTL
jgi:ABC-type glycerol-3-phosphate transport system substrate-binding protein